MQDGLLPPRVKDLRDQTFAWLTAREYVGNDGRRSLWVCQCKCGGWRIVRSTSLTNGDVKHCGSPQCSRDYRSQAHKGRSKTHGMSKHPAYSVWRSMIGRCRLPTHQAWANYGGRGLTVCDRWLAFENFWEDMGPTYRKGLTLDRIDNGRGYSKQNCRWVTCRQQARNTRRSRMINTPKGRMLVVEAAEVSGIGVSTLLYRVGAGWPAHRLFDTPSPISRIADHERDS